MLGLFWSLLESDSLLLFEEPELSLNGRIVSQVPVHNLEASKQPRKTSLAEHAQSCPSRGSGTSSNEIILLRPDKEGTAALNASSIEEVDTLLKAGMSAADAVLPHTVPAGVEELSL